MKASFTINFVTALMSCTAMAHAALSVTSTGTGWLTFDQAPQASEWSTLFLTCCAISNRSSLEAVVQSYAASSVSAPLPTSATYPPTTSGQNGAFWNSAGRFLQTRPAGGGAGILLMATFQNATSTNLSSVGLSFGMGLPVTNYSPGEVPGYYVYLSLTGATNSWQAIPELTGIVTNGDVSVVLSVGEWQPGTRLYLLFVDDNAQGVTDWPYTIDNFALAPFPIVIERPTLRLERSSSSSIQLAWDLPATGYLLQSASDVHLTNWTFGPLFVFPTNGTHRVEVPTSGDRMFFRLWKP